MKYLVKDVKYYNTDMEDLFVNYEDGDIIDDTNETITGEYGTDYISDIIWQTADASFIYYSEADDFLEDYDIWEEIANYKDEFGDTPKNQCALASYLYEKDLWNGYRDAISEAESLGNGKE